MLTGRRFLCILLADYLRKFDQATRQKTSQLLLPKLSEALDEQQKTNKINNLSTKLRKECIMENYGVDSAPQWRLAEKFAEKKQLKVETDIYQTLRASNAIFEEKI